MLFVECIDPAYQRPSVINAAEVPLHIEMHANAIAPVQVVINGGFVEVSAAQSAFVAGKHDVHPGQVNKRARRARRSKIDQP